MKIKSNQIYYTVEVQYWGATVNEFFTKQFVDKDMAIAYYKRRREAYNKLDEVDKMNKLCRLARVQNNHSITLSCCGFNVMDNFSFADEEPI